jgi:hypothetical protein
MTREKSELTPQLAKTIVEALRRNPNLTDAADMAGVHPRTLKLWIKRGLFPNPDPLCARLARAARHSHALLRGELFEVLKKAATIGFSDAGPDTKLTVWLYEKLIDEGELTWEECLPGPEDKHSVRQHLYAHPTAELLADLHAAGVKLVPLTETEKLLPAPVVDGEFDDQESKSGE